MKFTYNSGQRPLDGYTLKRGIGQGGFGEVYYGVSDGGKEVALKLVRGNQEVELRGVAQCLNLKHPNLVSLFDLRTDTQGDHWVVMEYIAGEPLTVVLNRHPQGLPHELAQQWFVALARAIGYLHDHGIVHRDLKPGNIFLENGLVKVGDYGLSKFISSSQRTAQTQSVGTVYYMAPEISTGNYNKQIDIYAAGIILYEMLTGRVPFEGESAGEILMKHLTSPPDLSKLPAEYVPILSKALAKNPAQRYASIAEMAKAVEGVGQKEQRAAAAARPGPTIPVPPPVNLNPVRPEPILNVLPVVSFRGQMAELSGSLALSVVLAGLLSILWAAVGRINDVTWIGSLFFLTVAVCWVVLVPAKFWDGRAGDSWVRRGIMMLLGVAVGGLALWLSGWSPAQPTEVWATDLGWGPPALIVRHHPGFQGQGVAGAASFLSYFALALCTIRWWKMADRRRSARFSAFPVLAAGFWALALLVLIPESPYGAVAVVMASVIVQWVSPWEQPPPPTARRMRLRYA
jgi:hypothetical protein